MLNPNWVCDPIEVGPLSRALIAELQMTNLEYSQKLVVLGEVFAAITANEAERASKLSKGKVSAKSMRESALMYFSNQCGVQLDTIKR